MVQGEELLMRSAGARLIMQSWHFMNLIFSGVLVLVCFFFSVMHKNQMTTSLYLLMQIYGPVEFTF